MRKMLFSAAAVLAVCLSMNAQDIKFGAKTGVNFANATGDFTEDVNGRTSFHVGAVAEFKISQNFSVQPEIVYSQQGFKYDQYSFDTNSIVETTFKLGYINVPIAAKYYVVEGLSIEAGPQFAFLTSAKGKGEAPGMPSVEVDIKDLFKTFGVDVFGGVAYDLPIGVFFQARYNAGLTKINDNDGEKIKNGVFQLSVGYKF